MQTILVLLRKEFRQIFRNRAMLPIIFVMPIVQLLVLAFAATFEVKQTPVALVVEDLDPVGRELVRRMEASGYFSVRETTTSARKADEAMQSGRVDVIFHMPRGLADESTDHTLQIVVNAQDGATAGVVQAYLSRIVADFNEDRSAIRVQGLVSHGGDAAATPVGPGRIIVRPMHWYNPRLDYQTYMVPGILVILVTMIGTFLSAMNVVREKEIGTIEQLNVTPIRKGQLIAGKLFPFWIIALFELAFGLLVAWLVFRIPLEGSLALIFALAAIYLLAMLGLGLWISTVTETQQQAMFIAWFILVVCILMSGLFTPIESMPIWAQWLTELNPIAHFIKIMRRVLLKGAGIEAVAMQAAALGAFAVVSLTLAVKQYRKVSS
ncbi:MAG: ABC transporter permease [Rhodothermales bacterium]